MIYLKKLKNSLIVLFTFIIVILIFFLAKNIKNNKNSSQNDKMISEINFLDSKLTSLLNGLNNITLDNFNITVTKTSSNSSTKTSENSDSENKAAQDEQSTQHTEQKDSSNTTTEQYKLENNGILTGNTDINWDEIKNEVEVLYTIIPTLTLDLYNNSINQDEILNFNKELDELTIVAKSEDKEQTLIKLANLYRYLPAYASNFTDDLEYISLLETKSNIFNSYVFVSINNWSEASNYLNKAIESYTRTLNNIQSKNNIFNSNKTYIILNELQSAVNIKDKEVFFIKYKNFIEETEKHNK